MISGHRGTGSVTIRGLQSGSGRFDLYGDVSGPNLTPIDSFLDHLVAGRLTDYASTRSAVVSGDYVVRTTWVDIDGNTQAITNEGAVDDIWLKSSGGPTRDGRSPGIDCAAPGQNSFAASAQNSYWHTLRFNLIQDGGGWYFRAGGTSGSAPITVGAVAPMLQLNPTLTGSQVKQILQHTCASDSFTGSVPNPNWGYGKLNLLRALDYARRLAEERRKHEFR
jgi:subtilisin family serine protease